MVRQRHVCVCWVCASADVTWWDVMCSVNVVAGLRLAAWLNLIFTGESGIGLGDLPFRVSLVVEE